MIENMEKIKEEVKLIVSSSDTVELKLDRLNNLLSTLKPIDHTKEMLFVCDAAIICANDAGKPHMVAQFCLIKVKAEISQTSFYIKDIKDLTLPPGWFAPALKVTKARQAECEKRVQEIWTNTQKYIDVGFAYLNKNPLIGAAGYCQTMAGEIYASYYLELKLYHFGSGRPWNSKLSNYRIISFLGVDNFLLLDRKSRKKITSVRKISLKCFKEAKKYYTEIRAWRFLADCYLSLGLEHHSFNSPIRSKIAFYRAEKLIKKYKIIDLEARLESMRKLPLIGSTKD